MADPLTVVGIVANIVQLVDFSTKVLARLNDFQSSLGKIPKAFRHIKAELMRISRLVVRALES